MKKRIALIILIALYLIVPAVIKRLPIYEPVPLEKHETFYRSIKDEIKNYLMKKYYEKNKQQITFYVEGEEFTGNLIEVSNGIAHYEGRKENRVFEYSFYITNQKWFSFLIWDYESNSINSAGVEISDYQNPTDTGNKILSQYVSLDRYDIIGENPFWYGVGPAYRASISGYPTAEAISIGFWENKLGYITTKTYGFFSDSELGFEINDDKLKQTIKKSVCKDYGKYIEDIKLDWLEKKENYWISKTHRGEMYVSVDVAYIKEYGDIRAYIYLFPRTAWIISKYVLGISATLMFTWVLVSEIKAYRRKKSTPIPTEQEEQTE